MEFHPLPFDASLDQYQKEAEQLFDAYKLGDSETIQRIRQRHPRFLDPKIPWLSLNTPDAEVRSAGLDLADMQLTIARWYDFQDWQALTEYVRAVTEPNSAVYQFESAVEAVIAGD